MHCSWQRLDVFVLFSSSPFFSPRFLPSSGPSCQAWCLLQGEGKTKQGVYFATPVDIHGSKYVFWVFFLVCVAAQDDLLAEGVY